MVTHTLEVVAFSVGEEVGDSEVAVGEEVGGSEVAVGEEVGGSEVAVGVIVTVLFPMCDGIRWMRARCKPRVL